MLFCNQPVLFEQVENVNYRTTTAPCMWTNEIKTKQNQVTSRSNWPHVILFDLAHKQCNGIIKGWLHCLTLESKGRFLVNNILMFGSTWCLIMAQIQFSPIKNNKNWTSRTPANLPPPTSNNISFFPYPSPPPFKGDVICASPLIANIWSLQHK